MSEQIFIWEGGNENVAHASMTLNGGTHISWWSTEAKSKYPRRHLMIPVTDPGPADSYGQDRTWKGRDHDHAILIVGGKLDTNAITLWWEDFKVTAINDPLHINGFTVIYEALRVGRAADYVAIPQNPVCTPAGLKSYVLELKHRIEGP